MTGPRSKFKGSTACRIIPGPHKVLGTLRGAGGTVPGVFWGGKNPVGVPEQKSSNPDS